MVAVCMNLPSLIKLSDYKNNWNEFYNYVYDLYLRDFFYNTVFYKGVPIKTFTQLNYEGKQQTFEHITTKGSNDRAYNQARIERYMWIKTIIESDKCSSCNDIAVWKEKGHKWDRVLIWCKSVDFLIILEKRNNEYFLISAYCVMYPNKRTELHANYEKYLKQNQSRLSRR